MRRHGGPRPDHPNARQRRWRARRRTRTVVQVLGVVLVSVAGVLALANGLLGSQARAQVTDGSPAASAQSSSTPAHHGPDGFHNRSGGDVGKGLWEVLRWQLTRRSPPLPDPPLPAATPQPELPPPQLTWIGHATVLIRLPGLTLLTDPQFSERASPVGFAGPRRAYPVPLSVAQLPHVDAVLVSHNHYDHLDLPSVRALVAQPGGPPRFIVPLGLKAWFDGLDLDPRPTVHELDWWQSLTLAGSEIALVPAHHWSSRTPWDRRRTLWGGFAVFAPGGPSLVYTGDTGYSADFADIRAHFAPRGPFDLALIPVGCYEPRAFMQAQHVDPPEAVRIFQDLGARRAIGVHWGTFADLCDEPLDQAPRDLVRAVQAAGLPADRFVVLRRGETRAIEVGP